MTRVSIHSTTPSLTRNITALCTQMGMEVTATGEISLRATEAGLQLNYENHTQELAFPLHPNRLLQAMHALLNPIASARLPLANGWVFDPLLRSVSHDDTTLQLTEKESELLAALLAASPELISRDALLKQVWSYDTELETHTVETHIYRLRQKLETNGPRPCVIETIEGSYRLLLDTPLF